MFIPYRIEADEYDELGVPWLTYAIITACMAVYLVVVNFCSEFQQEDIFYRFGCTPVEFKWWTTLSCTLLHGGMMHLLGNMYFLWIYGPLCEKVLGKVKFLLLYLIGAVVSVGGHVLTVPALYDDIPCVGASGAISAVLGAFLVLFPKVRIKFLVYTMLFPRALPTHGPAWFVLGAWFIVQLMSSLQLLGGSATEVAFWAHVFGFVAGAVFGSACLYFCSRRSSRRLAAGLRMLEEGIELDDDYMRELHQEKLIDSFLMNALGQKDELRAFDQLTDEWRQARSNGDDGKIILCYYRLVCRYGAERLDGDAHAWSAGAAARLNMPGLSRYAYYQAICANDGTAPPRRRMLENLSAMLERIGHDPAAAGGVQELLRKYYPNA
jgi:membrane associated rhomboid family serine protease